MYFCTSSLYFNVQENCLETSGLQKYGVFSDLFCVINSNFTIFQENILKKLQAAGARFFCSGKERRKIILSCTMGLENMSK